MSLKKSLVLATILAVLIAIGNIAVSSEAAALLASASGHGTLYSGVSSNGRTFRRQFSFSARENSDGTVTGNAVLVNPAFDGAHGNQPYLLQIDISCMNVIGNVAFFGGTTRRTTDPNLVDAVYFSIQDNGEPGANNDLLSSAFFFDDDPTTMGDPQLCEGNQLDDFPMEPIESGNINLRQ
jgi:hypothetical protein